MNNHTGIIYVLTCSMLKMSNDKYINRCNTPSDISKVDVIAKIKCYYTLYSSFYHMITNVQYYLFFRRKHEFPQENPKIQYTQQGEGAPT